MCEFLCNDQPAYSIASKNSCVRIEVLGSHVVGCWCNQALSRAT